MERDRNQKIMQTQERRKDLQSLEALVDQLYQQAE